METKAYTGNDVNLDETILCELRAVLDYLWEDERRSYRECKPQCRSNHIFESLVAIDLWLHGLSHNHLTNAQPMSGRGSHGQEPFETKPR